MSKPEALCCAVHRKMHGLPCRCMAMVCLSSIAMLSTEGFTPNHPPAHPDRPRTKASSSPHGVERHQRLAKAGVSLLLQGLGVSAPIVASAAPPPGATATLEEVSRLQDKAFSLTNRFNFVEADKVWTQLIDATGGTAAAWSNRGNCRTSLGRCKEAFEDFNQAIRLAPDEPDPYLGRGVSEECLMRYEDAIKDYETANEKNLAKTGREDPVTFNNRANAKAGLGQWEGALADFNFAAQMEPDYVFPRASAALTTYQLGDEKSAMKQIRLLLVKYPDFVDMKAALAVLYWKQGELGKAETQWVSVVNEDPRYRKLAWVRDVRKWPPRMVSALDDFLSLRLVPKTTPAVAPIAP